MPVSVEQRRGRAHRARAPEELGCGPLTLPEPAVHVSIAERRTLNSGGILPLAAGIPASLALLALGVRLRRRRR